MYARRYAAALLALTALLGACSRVVDGQGADSVAPSGSVTATEGPTKPSTSPSGPGTSGPGTSGSTTASPSGKPTPSANNAGKVLVPLLEQGPAGSRPWGDAWAANVTPTLQDFVAHVYSPQARPAITTELTRDKLTGIAHTTWIASDSTQADVILFQFADTTGADTRLRFAVQAKATTPGVKGFTTASSPVPLQTYYDTALDSDGYVRAITYTRVGSIVIEVFTFSPKRLSTALILQWSRAQVELLR